MGNVRIILALAGIVLLLGSHAQSTNSSEEDVKVHRIAWVEKCLQKFESI